MPICLFLDTKKTYPTSNKTPAFHSTVLTKLASLSYIFGTALNILESDLLFSSICAF